MSQVSLLNQPFPIFSTSVTSSHHTTHTPSHTHTHIHPHTHTFASYTHTSTLTHTHTHTYPPSHTPSPHTLTHPPSHTHRLGILPGIRVPPTSLSLSATITRSSSGTRQPVHKPLRWMGCTLTSSTPSLGATTAAILPPPVKTRRSGLLTHASRRLSQ